LKIYPSLKTGEPNVRVFTPRIARVVWSPQDKLIEREWEGKPALLVFLGDTTTIVVETQWVQDGAPVKLKIHPHGQPDEVLDEFQGQIKGCQFVKEQYKIDWGEKGQQLKPYTPLVATAELEKEKIAGESNVVLLGLEKFQFSF